MEAKKLSDTLTAFELRITKPRMDILTLFAGAKSALSHSDIEENLSAPKTDRVTIYRTLKVFSESGLIHKIADKEFGIKYALCDLNKCGHHNHRHNHAHFVCNQCGNTTCLADVDGPRVDVPIGFKIDEINISVSGLCNVCSVPA